MSLEKTFFTVDEGVVEVCANVSFPLIKCPIKFLFQVGLATDHQTAGGSLQTTHMTVVLY